MTEEELDSKEKCDKCEHVEHDPGSCDAIYFYARGPNDPPGNRRCLCGYEYQIENIWSNFGMSG